MSSAPPPPAVLAAQAAAAAAFNKFAIEAWTLLAIGLSVTILRTCARGTKVGWTSLQADDYMAWVGATFYAIETGLAYCVGNVAHGLANNGMTDAQRAALPADNPEYQLRITGSKIQLAGWTSYSLLLWSLKASLLAFYLRLTVGLGRTYRIRIYVGFGALLATWFVVIMTLFLSCRPFHRNWQIFPDPGNACQPAVSNQVIWTFLSCNVATDLYLLSIPVPMLWQTNLRPLKKLGLIVLFSGGLFVIVCATLRCIIIVTDPNNGALLAGSWAVRETFVAVVTTNLPMVYPLLKTWFSPILGSLLGTSHPSQKLGGNTPRSMQTFGSGGRPGWRSHDRRNGPPTTNTTFRESQENIVEDVKLQDMHSWSDSGSAGNPSGNTIQKHVDISVVATERGKSPQNSHSRALSGEGPHRQQSYSAFARGGAA